MDDEGNLRAPQHNRIATLSLKPANHFLKIGNGFGWKGSAYELVHDDAVDLLALLRLRTKIRKTSSGKLLRIDFALHQPSCPGQPDAMHPAGCSFLGDDLCDMQPRQRQARLDERQRLMNRVVRTDEELRPGLCQLRSGRQHDLPDALPVVAVDALHVVGKRMRVNGELRMSMRAHACGSFAAQGPVAEGGALCGTGDDSDVLGHGSDSRISSMAQIAIIGAGAIGGVVASLLQQTGQHELMLCLRRQLRQIIVESGSVEQRIDATFRVRPEDAHPVDWVMIATKAYDADAAASWLDKLCSTGAPVAVLQNGVEHRERFAPYIAKEKIVPVIVDCPAERSSSGAGDHILQRGPMSLRVPDSMLGREFVKLFDGSAADAAAVDDWTTVAWKKLCHNAVGALSALLQKPAGVLRDEAIGEVALDMLYECIAVGRAEGAELPDSFAEEVLAACRRSNPDSINSLLADRLAGRPMETAARNGAIVRKGRAHGIPTPTNAMAVALLEAMAAK